MAKSEADAQAKAARHAAHEHEREQRHQHIIAELAVVNSRLQALERELTEAQQQLQALAGNRTPRR